MSLNKYEETSDTTNLSFPDFQAYEIVATVRY